MNSPPLISLVDDDESVRESLPDLIREFGFAVEAFSSAEDFLRSGLVNSTKCLILDVGMPDMTGFELYGELQIRGISVPVIFITAHAMETIRPHVERLGPVKCLFKPFSDTALLDAIRAALQRS